MSDIVKDLTNYRIKGIEKAEIEYYKQLTQTLDRIEAQIVSLADQQLPRTAGKLIELQSAVAIRPKIKAILDKEYLPFADRVVRKGFGEQAKRVERQFKTIGLIPPEFQELTKGDLALVQNLKKQYYTQFKDVSNNFTRILSDKVYQNTLVGTEFTVLEKELRESINGIYATSSDPAVNRLVDYVKNNKGNPALASRVDAAVKILQTKYASTRVGENMKRYAGQILNDSLRDFDATLNFNKAKDAGLTYVKYYGDVIPTTRTLCRNMINGVYDKSGKGIYTIAEITRIWNSTSWSGKKSGTPMVVRGGYNCRHQFSYVNPDWYEEDGEESQSLIESKVPIVPKESIYGKVSKEEKPYLEKGFGTKPSPFTKAISTLPALKTFEKQGRGYYRRSSDTLNVGSSRVGAESAELQVFIHEYTHRIDRIIGQKFATDTALKSKFTKGVSSDILERRSLYDPRMFNSISHLKVQALIDDTKELTKGLRKRKLAFLEEHKKAIANSPTIVSEQSVINDYYKKLSSGIKTFLTDQEIMVYLASNSRETISGISSWNKVYYFKLKLKHKVLEPRFAGGFDRQFSGDFNDYIGAITKETMGAGHGKSYYSDYLTIMRDGNRTFTEGQTLEAWANHSAMSLNPFPKINDKISIREIERKIMNNFAPNTTKAFDDIVNNFNDL